MIENSLWVELFRPSTLDGYIGNESMVSKFKMYIENNDVPHLLLYGPAGTGKTTAAKILAKGLDADILYINASDENNIDTVRDKIKGFASSMGMHRWKIAILDECLESGTLVSILRANTEMKIPIQNLDDSSDLVKTFNIDTNTIEWKPFTLIHNGQRLLYEIELEDGSIFRCTENHKWFVMDGDSIKIVRTDQLYLYDHILSPIGV